MAAIKPNRLIVGAFALTASFLVLASPAVACSRAAPPNIADIVPGEPIPGYGMSPVLGVYEQEHIAGAPGLVLISSRTVSVVTRYWGTPPPHTYLQRHGEGLGVLGMSSCGNEAGHTGLIGYNWVDQSVLEHGTEWGRPLPSIDIRPSTDGFTTTTAGVLDAEQEAELTARFGTPVVLLNSGADRVLGILIAWQYHLALATVIAFAVFALWRLRTRTRSSDPATLPERESAD